MKNTFTFKTRAFAFFLAAQFLNVQIQTSFATEAVTANSAEAQAALQHVEKRISEKLAGKSEKAALKIAYKLYSLNLKLRNKAVQNAEAQVKITADEMDALNEVAPSAEGSNALADAPKVSKEEAKKEKVIAKADPVLTALGSELQADGLLSKVSFEQFKQNIEQLPLKNSLRSPASTGSTIVKVFLSLVILLAGFTIIYSIIVLTILYVWAGANVIGWLVVLMIAGVAVGAVFGLMALWSSTELQMIEASSTRC